MKAVQSIVTNHGVELNLWWFAIGIIIIYSPLAWVRGIGFWANFYTFAIMMIIFTTSVCFFYSVYNLSKHGQENPGFIAYDSKNMWDMIGFSFYCFEGIGVLLPIMESAQNPEKFEKLLRYSLFSLSVYFIVFGVTCFAWFGHME